ncbi:MAG TPA: DUF6785 family protein [Sedimentisphaerales bacterium]|nr:DUF6785 family protein [Sedimentisphaerales bacterium]
MTFRAIFIGVLSAIIFAAGGRYVNAYVPGVHMIRGHLPITVFGLLIFFVVFINPFIGWLKRSWKFRPSEMALILALLLAVSSIVDAGLMRFFPSVCVFPLHTQQTRPGWQATNVVSYVPRAMMANDGQYSREVVEGFVSPMGTEGDWIGFLEVPWHAWKSPLIFWGLVISLTFIGVIGLSVVVHRQWARRERIRYPLAEIASSLLAEDEAGHVILFKNRLFWVGVAIMLFIALLRTIALWHPEMVTIPMRHDFAALREAYPRLMQTHGAGHISNVVIYPAAIGIAFLLSSDIGLSLGIANPLSVFVLYGLTMLGVDMAGCAQEGSPMAWQTFGGYLAFGLMLLYIGRRYYWQTTKEALTFVKCKETDSAAVWGLRVFLFCAAGVVVVLMQVGLAWHIAVAVVLTVMLAYFVMARLNAEAGTFFYEPAWTLPAALLGFYGFSALGPAGFMTISLMYWMLVGDPFESLMPFAVNGLKTTSDTGLKVGKVGLVIGITIIAALAVTIPTALWSDYNHQAFTAGGRHSHQSYDVAERHIRRLELAGQLDEANNFTSWERLTNIRPEGRFIVSTAIGFVLVLLLSAARLRFAWWPLHPLLVLTFGAILMVGKYGPSFLIGWFIKVMVTRLAGASKYADIKPLMMGVIIGDLFGGFGTTCVLWAYYFVTGVQGPAWRFW